MTTTTMSIFEPIDLNDNVLVFHRVTFIVIDVAVLVVAIAVLVVAAVAVVVVVVVVAVFAVVVAAVVAVAVLVVAAVVVSLFVKLEDLLIELRQSRLLPKRDNNKSF